MTASTARHGITYLISADPVANTDDINESQIKQIDARLPYCEDVSISVTATDNDSVHVNFPASWFSSAPMVTATVQNSSAWFASVDNVTATGFDLYIRRPAGAATASVRIAFHAAPKS